MDSPLKSRSFRLPVILGINTVFVLMLGGSAFEQFQSQQKLLLLQEQKLSKLDKELVELRQTQKVNQQDNEDQRYRFVSTQKLETMFEAQQLAFAQQKQALYWQNESLQEQWRDQIDNIHANWQEKEAHLDARLSQLNDQNNSQGKRLDAYLNQSGIRYQRALQASVRINAKSEVGSGIVIFNGRRGSRERLETYILTAFHVIKDNLATKRSVEQPIDIDFYKDGQRVQTARARIVESETQQDLALLRVTSEVIAQPAMMAKTKALNAVVMFSKVLAIGCPLGYSPMPTHGEVTSTSKVFGQQNFWMINAPTIFGNSGGGVFDDKSGALLGVLIRIAAYKNVIDVAVPHLGIVTPLDQIKIWLGKTKHSFIFEKLIAKNTTATSVQAGRKKK
jgi:S1-C subfamily serine protease